MRNIVNVDCQNAEHNGVFNSDCGKNELLVSVRPSKNMSTNFKLQILKSNKISYFTGVIEPTGGIDNALVEYLVPFGDYSTQGTMKIKLVSDEASSEWFVFVATNHFTEEENICCKYAGGFIISKCRDVDPIIDLLYPIGAVVNNEMGDFNPNELYKGTFWERIKGRFLVGVDEDDTWWNTGGTTRGSKRLALRACIGAVNDDTGSLGYVPAAPVANIPNYEMSLFGMRGGGRQTRINHSTAVTQADGADAETTPPCYAVYTWVRRS